MKFLNNIDLLKYQLLNLKLQQIAGDHASPEEGVLWWDSNAKAIKVHNGTTIQTLGISGGGGDADTLGGNAGSYYLARGNHTGTQSADTITDGTTNKVFTATNQTKLNGIATGATANDTDANLRARSSHTGTQAPSTIAFAATARILGRNTTGAGAGEELTAAQVKAMLAIAAADVSGLNTAVDGRITSQVTAAFINALSGVDADTLGGQTAGQIQTAITSAIVDSAPGTLDTLNELAAALGDDPNFATTITNSIAAKAGKYAANVGNGSLTTFNIDHNLNSLDVIVQVFEVASGEQVMVNNARTTANRVVLTFATAPTTNQYRVVVIG